MTFWKSQYCRGHFYYYLPRKEIFRILFISVWSHCLKKKERLKCKNTTRQNRLSPHNQGSQVNEISNNVTREVVRWASHLNLSKILLVFIKHYACQSCYAARDMAHCRYKFDLDLYELIFIAYYWQSYYNQTA